LFDKPLYGRDLPLITNDFRKYDIELPGLYRSLSLPVDWFARDTLYNRLREGLQKTYRAYGQEITEEELRDAIELLTKNDRIDFGVLDETTQEQILELLIHRPSLHHLFRPDRLIPEGNFDYSRIIENNKKAIQENFNLEQYKNRLLDLYKDVANSPTSSVSYGLSKPLLNRFLNPEMFTLLRT
jgi:hypothetical protein